MAILSAQQPAAITIDYPAEGSIFPPDIIAPTFLWRDPDPSASVWRIDVDFGDGSAGIRVNSPGEKMRIGEIDPRCVSPTNEPPKLTPQQAAAHTWTPDAQTWAAIKQRVKRANSNRDDRRRRIPRPGHDSSFERSGGRADLLPGCPADAFGTGKGSDQAAGRQKPCR